MIPVLCLLLGLAAGGTFVWWTQRAELSWLRKEVLSLTDRLVHAHLVEKAVIPPRPIEKVPIVPLSSILQAEVDQWEDPEAKANARAKIEALKAQGLSEPAIVVRLNEPAGVGA